MFKVIFKMKWWDLNRDISSEALDKCILVRYFKEHCYHMSVYQE
jgi:hypothetical protein